MPPLIKSTALDYRLPQTVEYIQQGWLNTCQNGAVTSGLLTIVATLLLLFFTNSPNFNATHQDSPHTLVALELIGYISIFLNISACMSCFILLDRLGEVPYHASRDINVPAGGKIVLEQEGILRIYGVGALWQWVVWHWLFCFIGGAWSIIAQLLVYIWMQESRKNRIGLTCLGVFCILPFCAFILAPIVNRWRGTRKNDADTFSNVDSRRDSRRDSTSRTPITPHSPHFPPPNPTARGGNGDLPPSPRDRLMSMASSGSSRQFSPNLR